jgi:aminoglycoside phosphotransferase family enzyme/predicted kinase
VIAHVVTDDADRFVTQHGRHARNTPHRRCRTARGRRRSDTYDPDGLADRDAMSTTATAIAVAADPVGLRRSLERLTGAPVASRETHCSVVLLTLDRAYKLKKPVVFDFVDQRSAATREAACHRELELNRAMAPGIGLAVRAVLPTSDGYALRDAGTPGAVDHVVEMRRFDEASTMRGLLERGMLTVEQATAVGVALATFHAAAPRLAAAPDERALLHHNMDALLALDERRLPASELLGLQHFADAFVAGYTEVFTARARHGLVIDGHGDLRAEHVLIEPDRIRAVDRLEWDELRRVDVADDLAFLLMDLESRGAGVFATAVLAGYVHATGTRQPGALLGFYGAYRAEVRSKVALLRDDQTDDGSAGTDEARNLIDLARTLAWRARCPGLLLVTGPPASGKSTLAAGLSTAAGLPVIASDDVRADADGAHEYSMSARAAVYRRMAEAATERGPCIVDATFGDPVLQEAFFSALCEPGSLLAVECVAPPGVRIDRAAQRHIDGGSLSDAGPEVAQQLGDRYVPLTRLAGACKLTVQTEAPLSLQVQEVESWLDARLSGAFDR